MTTGKNKEQFEKWYNRYDENYIDFNHLQFEMQIGVYLAYYDSLGIEISLVKNDVLEWWFFEINKSDVFCEEKLNSRNEAYKEAFKKANELVNK